MVLFEIVVGLSFVFTIWFEFLQGFYNQVFIGKVFLLCIESKFELNSRIPKNIISYSIRGVPRGNRVGNNLGSVFGVGGILVRFPVCNYYRSLVPKRGGNGKKIQTLSSLTI
jgi:hypothetical protein